MDTLALRISYPFYVSPRPDITVPVLHALFVYGVSLWFDQADVFGDVEPLTLSVVGKDS